MLFSPAAYFAPDGVVAAYTDHFATFGLSVQPLWSNFSGSSQLGRNLDTQQRPWITLVTYAPPVGAVPVPAPFALISVGILLLAARQ